jgi:hypothetical protein
MIKVFYAFSNNNDSRSAYEKVYSEITEIISVEIIDVDYRIV